MHVLFESGIQLRRRDDIGVERAFVHVSSLGNVTQHLQGRARGEGATADRTAESSENHFRSKTVETSVRLYGGGGLIQFRLRRLNCDEPDIEGRKHA
jgi:hypothetical protein